MKHDNETDEEWLARIEQENVEAIKALTAATRSPEWAIEFSSFTGVAFNAEHYYVEFKRNLYLRLPDRDDKVFHQHKGEKVVVEREITSLEARKLRKKDGMPDRRPEAYELYTRRFNSREEAEAAARKVWEKIAAPGEWCTGSMSRQDEIWAGEEGESNSPGGWTTSNGPLKDVDHTYIVMLDGTILTSEEFMDLKDPI